MNPEHSNTTLALNYHTKNKYANYTKLPKYDNNIDLKIHIIRTLEVYLMCHYKIVIKINNSGRNPSSDTVYHIKAI